MAWVKRKGFWGLFLAISLCAGGSYYYYYQKGTQVEESAKEIAINVVKGDIRFSVMGTSQLEPKDMQTIIAPADGTIKSINLTRNKSVKKDEVLIEISSPTLETNLQKGILTLTQLQKDLNDLKDQQGALQTKAPISGKITYANNLDVGTTVTKTTKIATISDLKTLNVTLPFQLEDAVKLQAGDFVDLAIDGLMLSKTGTVQTIGKDPKGDLKGGKLIDIDIMIKNDDTMDAGMKAKGSIILGDRTISSQDQGTLQYNKVVTILANVTGAIDNLFFKSGNIIHEGEIISSILNDSLKDDVANKKSAVDQQKVSVDDMQDKVDALRVRAPFDGVFSTDFVNKKTNVLANLTKGSKVSNNTQFGGVASLESMQLPIQVDELDLPSIKTGMPAEVRVDSVPGKIFKASVSQVSSVGNTTNGVTFFDVVLAVANTKELKYGMTATGEIIIQDKKDVLKIPNEALQGKKYVSLKLPDGSIENKHEVKMGLRDKTHVEIVEGLKLDDQVVIPLLQKQQKLNPLEVEKIRKQYQGEGTSDAGGGAQAPKADKKGK